MSRLERILEILIEANETRPPLPDPPADPPALSTELLAIAADLRKTTELPDYVSLAEVAERLETLAARTSDGESARGGSVKPIDDAVRDLLIERGWGIDPDAVENASGELHEFVHPETGKKFAWIDALMEDDLDERVAVRVRVREG